MRGLCRLRLAIIHGVTLVVRTAASQQSDETEESLCFGPWVCAMVGRSWWWFSMEVTYMYSNPRTNHIASTPIPSTPYRKTAIRAIEM
jgi:hypothetical protein